MFVCLVLLFVVLILFVVDMLLLYCFGGCSLFVVVCFWVFSVLVCFLAVWVVRVFVFVFVFAFLC